MPVRISIHTKRKLLEIKKRPPDRLDRMVQEIHYKVFDKVDCPTCAECCKRISPRINQYDLLRAAEALRMKPSEFVEKYCRRDNEGDYVFNTKPCPFLGHGNYCEIYKDRPSACRDYPHTDRRRFYQLIELSITNAEVCPAVADILEELVRKVK